MQRFKNLVTFCSYDYSLLMHLFIKENYYFVGLFSLLSFTETKEKKQIRMMTRLVIFVWTILRMASGELNCLCNFSNQTIYSSPSLNATVLVSVYKSCLVVAANVTTDLWVPVVHRHEVNI